MSTPPVPPGRPDPDDLEPDPTGIRDLLGSLPDPGPMPDDLVARITASIEAEQRARSGAAREGGSPTSGPGATVVPLAARRRRRWRQVGLVAAAVAVLAVALPSLLLGGGPGGVVASLSSAIDGAGGSDNSAAGGSALEDSSSGGATSGSGQDRMMAGKGAVTLAATGTAYTRAALTSQVVLARDSSPSASDSRAPLAGAPADTDAGVRSCLGAIGVPVRVPVWADRATYEGKPAVVVVAEDDTAASVYVVAPTCDGDHPAVLAGPLRLP